MKNNLMTKSLSLILLLTASIHSLALATEKVYVPTHPQARAPLFVALHGCLSTAEDSEKTTRMSEFAEKHGFYVLYPEPSLGADSKGCFNFYTEESQKPGGGDAAVIVARIEELIKTYDIDPEKIYVLGMSGGASLVSVLTSCYPNVIKGAAIHSGMGYGLASTWQSSLFVAAFGPDPFYQRNTTCSPSSYQGKLFLIQGTRDQVMNPRHFDTLKEDYLSNTKVKSEFVGPKSTKEYGYFHERYYENEKLKGHGILVVGMNHEWSGAGPINPFGPKGPDVSSMIVDYFLDNP